MRASSQPLSGSETRRLARGYPREDARVQEKAGFIPNVFVTLAHRPDEFRAFLRLSRCADAARVRLTKAEREMIVVATSGANDCLYCIVAHGAILRVYAKNSLVADQSRSIFERPTSRNGRRQCSNSRSRSRCAQSSWSTRTTPP
jgi:uncharacterized peroxidase-related enzyme